jgi:diguanylate cyclase
MTHLVDLIAPRSWKDGLWKGFVFLVLVNLLNFGVVTLVRRISFNPGPEIIVTTVVALPFILIGLGTLYHQRVLQQKRTMPATTDMLTGLPNRRAFLARTIEATQGGQTGALLLLDADHFKLINDTWAHSVGDVCLAAIAERLRQTFRPGDIAGRLEKRSCPSSCPGPPSNRRASSATVFAAPSRWRPRGPTVTCA